MVEHASRRRALAGRIRHLGLIPVVRASGSQAALELCQALVSGGIRLLEVTMTVPNALAVIERLSSALPPDVLLGAGTVTHAQQARDCVRAGARFIVSPAMLPELIEQGHADDVPVALGALTPTEVWMAHRGGADFVKVFPCSALGGAAYLKALRGPFPQVPLLPTGGVTLETMAAYCKAGAVALGIGTALANPELLQREGPSAVTQLAARYVREFERHRAC